MKKSLMVLLCFALALILAGCAPIVGLLMGARSPTATSSAPVTPTGSYSAPSYSSDVGYSGNYADGHYFGDGHSNHDLSHLNSGHYIGDGHDNYDYGHYGDGHYYGDGHNADDYGHYGDGHYYGDGHDGGEHHGGIHE